MGETRTNSRDNSTEGCAWMCVQSLVSALQRLLNLFAKAQASAVCVGRGESPCVQ